MRRTSIQVESDYKRSLELLDMGFDWKDIAVEISKETKRDVTVVKLRSTFKDRQKVKVKELEPERKKRDVLSDLYEAKNECWANYKKYSNTTVVTVVERGFVKPDNTLANPIQVRKFEQSKLGLMWYDRWLKTVQEISKIENPQSINLNIHELLQRYEVVTGEAKTAPIKSEAEAEMYGHYIPYEETDSNI